MDGHIPREGVGPFIIVPALRVDLHLDSEALLGALVAARDRVAQGAQPTRDLLIVENV